MSFSEPKGFIHTTFGKLALFAAALVGLGFGGALLTTGWGIFTASQYDEDTFEDELAAIPALDPLFAEMRTAYPEEYRDFRAMTVRLARQRTGPRELQQAGIEFMAGFTQRHQRSLRAAPTEDVNALRDRSLAIVEAFGRESATACAQFVNTGLPFGFTPSSQLMTAMAEGGAQQIRTFAAGRDGPMERAAASDADWEALGDAMIASGTSERQMIALGSGNLAALDPVEGCDLGAMIYRGMQRLPDDQSARLMVAITLEASEQQGG